MLVNYAKIDEMKASEEILKNEIENVSVFYNKIEKGIKFITECQNGIAKVFILSEGKIVVDGKIMENKGVFSALSDHNFEIEALFPSAILELSIKINEDEADRTKLPYYLNYEDAITYKEDVKSEKTVSRFLLKQKIIPDLAIGSVETYGPDEVGVHDHPCVEQLFFGFSENDVELVINGEKFHMGGNTIVHIPLASEHGVLIEEGKCAHYVWIDYIIDKEKGLDYLDNAHSEN